VEQSIKVRTRAGSTNENLSTRVLRLLDVTRSCKEQPEALDFTIGSLLKVVDYNRISQTYNSSMAQWERAGLIGIQRSHPLIPEL